MLGCMAAPAHAGWFSSDAKPAEKAPATKPDDKAAPPAATLDDSILQAQMLRLAGQYPEAIKHLSQLMMVASDDARIISEYGKTLTAMGRASDAVNFLSRAQQLQPGDWTIYSAMGVAYDQMGDQKNAQVAYEHALTIKRDEPSVLNNYALSRMLAKDPEMARKLAARAESTGGASDAKIARNIAMIRSLAPETAAPVTQIAHVPAPASSVTKNAAAAQTSVPENKVVMQRVPVDPLAGSATQAPRPLQPKSGQMANLPATPAAPKVAETVKAGATSPTPPPVKAAGAAKPATVANVVTPVTVKAVEIKPATLKAAEVAKLAIVANVVTSAAVKAAEVKPAPVKAAEVPKPAIIAKAMPAPVKTAVADKASPSVTLKMAPAAEAGKPASAPKVLPPVKAAAKPDAVPGLRMSANAY